MSGTLALELVDTTVRVDRGDVPDGFWWRLLSEWGTTGQTPGSTVNITLDRVLSHTGWLKAACRQYQVSIDWGDSLKKVIADTQQERTRLAAILANPPHLSAEVVAERLAGTRFTRVLREFQVDNVGTLLALDNGANFSVPGAGKTTSALAVYEAERAAGRVEQMLVVAPLSAFDAWQAGVKECFDGEKPTIASVTTSVPENAEIVLVNYHRLDSRFSDIADWVRARPTLVLLDEAHRMKRGWDGQFGSACLNMAPLAARRDILTGTPAPQSPQDFTALINFLWPGQSHRILPRDAVTPPFPQDAGARVAAAIQPIFVRTKKSDLQLPGVDKEVLIVEPSELQMQIYAALKDQYQGGLSVSMTDRTRFARMGQVVMYLLEAATNPKLLSAGSTSDDVFRHPPLDVEPGSSLWELLRRYNEHETPAKFAHLARIIKENAEAGKKTLIWTNFVRNIHALQRMLARYEPAAVYGAIPSEVSNPKADLTREQELERFRDHTNNCKVLLANPAAMSEGVSLHHTAHDAVYLDRTFNAGQYLQSVDRIHRLGMESDQYTKVTYLITRGTIDEVINARVAQKAELLGQMLDDPSIAAAALPSDEDYSDAVDVDDLEALFAHLRGTS